MIQFAVQRRPTADAVSPAHLPHSLDTPGTQQSTKRVRPKTSVWDSFNAFEQNTSENQPEVDVIIWIQGDAATG